MTDYTELVKDLRDTERICRDRMDGQVMLDAADAIEALQAEIRESMQRCAECGDELAHQLPKRGEIVRCGECAHCYAEGFAHERNICEKHPELGNVPDDWFCADGEREVQE